MTCFKPSWVSVQLLWMYKFITCPGTLRVTDLMGSKEAWLILRRSEAFGSDIFKAYRNLSWVSCVYVYYSKKKLLTCRKKMQRIMFFTPSHARHTVEVLPGARLLLSGAVGLLTGLRLLSAISVSRQYCWRGVRGASLLQSDGYLFLVRSTRVERATPNSYFGSSSILNTQAAYW